MARTKPMGDEGWERAKPMTTGRCFVCEGTTDTKAFHNIETNEHVALCRSCYDNLSSLPTKFRPCECGKTEAT